MAGLIFIAGFIYGACVQSNVTKYHFDIRMKTIEDVIQNLVILDHWDNRLYIAFPQALIQNVGNFGSRFFTVTALTLGG